MLINENFLSEITFIQNNSNVEFFIQLMLCFVFVFSFFSTAAAQWVNDPKTNTKLVLNTSNPINISTVKDFNGGAFIIWQDKKEDGQNQVYFIHFDAAGNVTLRADGKIISNSNNGKELPVTAENLPNSAVVMWKDFSKHTNGDLFVQRVSNTGSYLWNSNGLQITNNIYNVYDYSVSSDKSGNVYISFAEKNAPIEGSYLVGFQKITAEGKVIFDSLKTISKSINRKSMTSVVPDNSGGAYIYWLENINNKTVLFLNHINSTGSLDWKKPVQISSVISNVINYTVKVFNVSKTYVSWQVLKVNKDIYHQLIDEKGKLLWGNEGKIITEQKGNQINPQAVCSDSSIILSWTDDSKNDQDVYAQKFNKNGKPLWRKDGLPVINMVGAQFGQKIISDGNSGAVISWIDRRQDSTLANIYSQRISSTGQFLWDANGVQTASHYNTPKSYLSLVTDESNGAIAILKEYRDNSNVIYGQRIFDSGTFASQIIGFNSELIKDSVKLSWYGANVQPKTFYEVQRTIQSDTGTIPWTNIATIKADPKINSKYFEFYDKPDYSGTLYYRIIQKDSAGNSQTSAVERVNYLNSATDITLAQNIPNPFSDSTSITFFIPESQKVLIEFFNSRLEKISEINKNFPAGKNSITFSAEGLSSGIYFFRLKVDDFVDVKKMVISK